MHTHKILPMNISAKQIILTQMSKSLETELKD